MINKIKEIIDKEKDFFISEGIELPNDDTINITVKLLEKLENINIKTNITTMSGEGGFCLILKNGDKTMYMELYNSGEFGYIIDQYEKILENHDLIFIKEVEDVIIKFNSEN